MNKEILHTFFQKEIAPYTAKLEQEIRHESNSVKLFLALFAALFMMVVFFDSIVKYIDKGTMVFAFIAGMIVSFFLIQRARERGSRIDKMYERIVIQPLLKKIDPSLRYFRNRGFDEVAFQKSGLFDGYHRYKSNKLFEGEVDGMPLTFANVHVVTGHYNDNKNEYEERDLFHGLFISTKMKKRIRGQIVVYPDFAEKLFGIMGRGLQSKQYRSLQRVSLDNPEFERAFKVYASDAVEARYVLSHMMMERIAHLAKRLGKSHNLIYISFTEDTIYLGIHNFGFLQRDSARMARKDYVIDFEHISYHLEMLELAMSLSKVLRLESVV